MRVEVANHMHHGSYGQAGFFPGIGITCTAREYDPYEEAKEKQAPLCRGQQKFQKSLLRVPGVCANDRPNYRDMHSSVAVMRTRELLKRVHKVSSIACGRREPIRSGKGLQA